MSRLLLRFVPLVVVGFVAFAPDASAQCKPGVSAINDRYTFVVSNALPSSLLTGGVLTIHNPSGLPVNVRISEEGETFNRASTCLPAAIFDGDPVICTESPLNFSETLAYRFTVPAGGNTEFIVDVSGNSGRPVPIVTVDLYHDSGSNTGEYYDHFTVDRDCLR